MFKHLIDVQEEQQEVIANLRGYADLEIVRYSGGVQCSTEDIVNELVGHLPYLVDVNLYSRFFIPIVTPTNALVSYVLFDSINYFKRKNFDENLGVYFLPKQKKNIYVPALAWEQVLSSEFVGVVDGVWDAVYLNYVGFPAISIMQSSFGKNVVEILRCWKTLYIFSDSDAAGASLYQSAVELFPNCFRVTTPTKDIDEFLKLYGKTEFYKQFKFSFNTQLKIPKNQDREVVSPVMVQKRVFTL